MPVLVPDPDTLLLLWLLCLIHCDSSPAGSFCTSAESASAAGDGPTYIHTLMICTCQNNLCPSFTLASMDTIDLISPDTIELMLDQHQPFHST